MPGEGIAPSFPRPPKMFKELHTPHLTPNRDKSKCLRSANGGQAGALSAIDQEVKTRGVQA